MFTGTRMRDLTLHTVCADTHDEDYSSDECYSSSSISLLFFFFFLHNFSFSFSSSVCYCSITLQKKRC